MFILSNMGKDQEFLEAARNGNITVVEKILNQKAKRTGPLASLRRGPGANVQDSSGYSALHHAALNGHIDIVHLLLAHGASPNLPDSRGASPLHLAAWAGHQDIVKLFLAHSNKPANPNLQTVDHETPLHYAAQHGHTGALTILLAHGADPNVMNSRNETPLDLAAQYGRLQAVQMLIRAHPELLLPFKLDASSSGGGNNGDCSSNGDGIVNGHNSNRSIVFNHTPLHLASRNGHKNVVEILLAAGVNVNVLTPSGTALHEAALCGKDVIVQTLLDYGADLNATDYEGRTALDILEEFPPHVTKGIVSVINNHRNSMAYDSESDDIRDNHTHHKSRTTPMSLGSSYENNRGSPVQNYYNSQYDITTSPSSSMGSLGASSPTSRSKLSSNDLPDLYLPMNSFKKPKAPKKPPRRNLSISPTHLQPRNYPLASTSMDDGGDGGGFRSVYEIMSNNSSNRNCQNAGAYEYICMARTGQKFEDKISRTLSVDHYIDMNASSSSSSSKNHQNNSAIPYDNTIFKSYNPNRKLKRNQNTYESFNIDFNKDKDINNTKDYVPQSPTNYQQPPTPEHPPPSAKQAEKCIYERIRPLSQEYKRRSGTFMIETSTSPPELLCSPLCASSGSISSSVSISDRSVSTDCVEEFIGDVPFAGLFKGSTMNLNNLNTTNNHSNQQNTRKYYDDIQHQQQYYQYSSANSNGSYSNQERPKTLYSTHDTSSSSSSVQNNSISKIQQQQQQQKQKQQQQQSSSVYQKNYQKSRSLSFGEILSENRSNLNNSTTTSNQNNHHYHHQNYIQNKTQNQNNYNVKRTERLKSDGIEDIRLMQHHDAQKQENLRKQLQNDIKAYLTKTAAAATAAAIAAKKEILQKQSNLIQKSNTPKLNNDINKDTINQIDNKDINTRCNNEENNDDNRDDDNDHKVAGNSSPFDEEAAWEKISEIMKSFGQDILSSTATFRNESLTMNNGDANEDENIIKDTRLETILKENDLEKYKDLLIENGFDNIDFMNGILDASDMTTMNIPSHDQEKFIKIIDKLPYPQSLPILHNNNNTILNVDQWLQSIQLSEYLEIFKQHLHLNVDGVCRVWEIELQTVLEIKKLGHRKRILHSLSNSSREPLSSNTSSLVSSATLEKFKANILELQDDFKDKLQTTSSSQSSTNDKPPISPSRNHDLRNAPPSKNVSGIRYNNKKNRPAPKPPIRNPVIEIRAPKELLLGLPSNLQTQWRHPANSLINDSIKYDAYYLGSTVVKELRGTESTRKSIQKLKKGERISSSSINVNQQQPPSQILNNKQITSKKQPVRLSISYRGVEFIDIETQKTICEHAIRNINCACQDADDLSHFAYITKDTDKNTHYCHVFNVDSMDLATEIILTLGQAFEVAYQLALRDKSTKK